MTTKIPTSSVVMDELEELERMLEDAGMEQAVTEEEEVTELKAETVVEVLEEKPAKFDGKTLPASTLNASVTGSRNFRVRADDEYPEEVRHLIPPREDVSHYFWPAPFVKSAHELLEHGISTRMYGPPGCGKSTLLRILAGVLRIPYVEVIGDREKDGGDFIGRTHARDGSTVYIEGVIVPVLEHGGIVFYDEWAKTLSAHNSWIHPVMDDRRFIDIPEHTEVARRKIPLSDKAMLVIADNTSGTGDGIGMYSSVIQDLATLDRFDSVISMWYPPTQAEVAIIKRETGIKAATATKLVGLANSVRSAWKEGKLTVPWTVRRTKAFAKKVMVDPVNVDYIEVATQVYIDTLPDEVEKQLAKNLTSNVFG